MSIAFADQSAVLTNSWNPSLSNVRQVLAPAVLTAQAGCNQVRVSFLFFGGGQGYAIGKCFIGQMGASAPNFAGDQAQVTFNGGADTFISLTTNAAFVSDWVTLPQNWDATKSYVVAFFISFVPGNIAATLGFLTGADAYSETTTGVDSSGTTVMPGSIGFSPGFLFTISKIEVQPGAAPIVLTLGSAVQDIGLSALALANKMLVCSQVPTTYAEANTYTLGAKNWGIGNVVGARGAGTGGRKVTTAAVTDGLISAAGTPNCWVIIDDVNGRLLASGPISGAAPVTIGQFFTLSSFDITMPGALT